MDEIMRAAVHESGHAGDIAYHATNAEELEQVERRLQLHYIIAQRAQAMLQNITTNLRPSCAEDQIILLRALRSPVDTNYRLVRDLRRLLFIQATAPVVPARPLLPSFSNLVASLELDQPDQRMSPPRTSPLRMCEQIIHSIQHIDSSIAES